MPIKVEPATTELILADECCDEILEPHFVDSGKPSGSLYLAKLHGADRQKLAACSNGVPHWCGLGSETVGFVGHRHGGRRRDLR